MTFSGKSLVYLGSLQLVFSQPPNSMVSAACGLLAGALYRANFLGARQWRVPAWTQRLGSKLLMPLLASGRVPRRSTRTSLEDSDSGPASVPRPSAGTGTIRGTTTARQGAISEVVQTLCVSAFLSAQIYGADDRMHLAPAHEAQASHQQMQSRSFRPCSPAQVQNRSPQLCNGAATTSIDLSSSYCNNRQQHDCEENAGRCHRK